MARTRGTLGHCTESNESDTYLNGHMTNDEAVTHALCHFTGFTFTVNNARKRM